jgi:hypothetical protein
MLMSGVAGGWWGRNGYISHGGGGGKGGDGVERRNISRNDL